ncbi:MAG: DNA recombination protein RmuC [Halieaceae bacterium]|jgi:DNA recombination protein RmuC
MTISVLSLAILGAGITTGILLGVLLGVLLRAATLGKLRSELSAAWTEQESLAIALGEARTAGDTAERTANALALEGRGLETSLERMREQSAQREVRLQALERENSLLREARAGMNAEREAMQRQHSQQLAFAEDNKRQLREEFQNLANRIFEERGKQLGSTQQAALESLLKPFGDKINQFQSRVNEVHQQSVRGQATLSAELKQLLSVGLKMNDQAENLTRALKGDKKITGNWGEVQLERTLQLAGLERGVHYEAQTAMQASAGHRQLPDFLIKLPDGKHLVIDSKVSLVDYDRAVSAETEEERDAALKAHGLALQRHIDSLAAKDYAALPGLDSPSLVFMFMPIEAAYIEALRYNRELFNDGYRKNVVMVSHTTLVPILRTVANLWIAYQSNEEALAISEMAGDVYNKVCLVGQRLEDMGKTLNTVTEKYNQTVTALVGKQGLHGKVDRFKRIAANAKGDLPAPQTQHPTIDHGRLAALGEAETPKDAAVTAESSQGKEKS